ncbi:MAG TPA: GNAT family N-acetyltransferase [Xanthobacteraceae bacterium]|jgi:CelD/BcsL family acetyltransferase involved in cellulose biosynthesis|nr:GNAT family N-acetyltransferase [Xanthobacteraceae bacterium]
MSQAMQVSFDGPVGTVGATAVDTAVTDARPATEPPCTIRCSVHDDLAAIERDWRAFERIADCTVFQSFDWLSTWQRHIGSLKGVTPAIVIGRGEDGEPLFLFPLAVTAGGWVRRLTWLGAELCDYNGPLLAPDFSGRVDAARFARLWRDVLEAVRRRPGMRFDVVDLDKMQPMVGAQPNPFIGLGVLPNPNGAYLTRLTGDWEQFYAAKRSSSTRRRDRTKRKRLAEFGEVRFVNPQGADIAATLATLVEQKSKALAAMGVANIFARPGHRAFYDALATEPALRDLVHISRLDVGTTPAAVNLGLIFRGSYYHVLASYDGGEVSRFGPGAAHMHELLRYAIERGCGVFDFTIGDERYKQEWCDDRLTLLDHVSAATLRGVPAALRAQAIGRIKHRIKQTPTLWDVAEKVRALLGPLLRRLGR